MLLFRWVKKTKRGASKDSPLALARPKLLGGLPKQHRRVLPNALRYLAPQSSCREDKPLLLGVPLRRLDPAEPHEPLSHERVEDPVTLGRLGVVVFAERESHSLSRLPSTDELVLLVEVVEEGDTLRDALHRNSFLSIGRCVLPKAYASGKPKAIDKNLTGVSIDSQATYPKVSPDIGIGAERPLTAQELDCSLPH